MISSSIESNRAYLDSLDGGGCPLSSRRTEPNAWGHDLGHRYSGAVGGSFDGSRKIRPESRIIIGSSKDGINVDAIDEHITAKLIDHSFQRTIVGELKFLHESRAFHAIDAHELGSASCDHKRTVGSVRHGGEILASIGILRCHHICGEPSTTDISSSYNGFWDGSFKRIILPHLQSLWSGFRTPDPRMWGFRWS